MICSQIGRAHVYVNPHSFTNMDKDEAVRVRAFWKPVIEKLPDYAYLCDEILREAQENEEENGIDFSEAERKEIERVYGVFKDYIHASKFLDFVGSICSSRYPSFSDQTKSKNLLA